MSPEAGAPPGRRSRGPHDPGTDITDLTTVTRPTGNQQRHTPGVGVTCPDCAVPTSGWDLVHEPTCPLGRQTEATSREDARWFRLHPDKDERWRPVRRDEITLLRLFQGLPDGTEIRGTVGVLRIGDGLRAKVFDGLTITAGGGAR